MFNEYMSAEISNGLMYKSYLTITLFEDMDWYL